jgi:hypothetical protein
MFKQEPSTEALCMQLKYGPWMDALKRAWLSMSRVQRPASSIQLRAEVLQKALTRVAQLISAKPVPQKWVDHAGRSVCRHSGGCQVLRGLGIVRKGGSHIFYSHHVGKEASEGYSILRSARSSGAIKASTGPDGEQVCMYMYLYMHAADANGDNP